MFLEQPLAVHGSGNKREEEKSTMEEFKCFHFKISLFLIKFNLEAW